jgi:hypothetical protein
MQLQFWRHQVKIVVFDITRQKSYQLDLIEHTSILCNEVFATKLSLGWSSCGENKKFRRELSHQESSSSGRIRNEAIITTIL